MGSSKVSKGLTALPIGLQHTIMIEQHFLRSESRQSAAFLKVSPACRRPYFFRIGLVYYWCTTGFETRLYAPPVSLLPCKSAYSRSGAEKIPITPAVQSQNLIIVYVRRYSTPPARRHILSNNGIHDHRASTW